MELSAGALNRTLLARQHLLARTDSTVPAMVEHLVGLQAQDPLPPYLGLAARLETFDPYDVTRGLEDCSLVRFLTLRSTVHLLTADDALMLRRFTRPIHEQERKVSQYTKPARHLDRDEFSAAVRRALAGGPLPMKRLGEALAETFPDVPPNALAHLARVDEPIAQLPPRGCWKQPGGVVYDRIDSWVGRPLVEPDVEAVVRRYLAAYGPASAADVTAWSGVRGMPAVLAGMDDLVPHTDAKGKKLFDLATEVIEPAASPAPVRLLGVYDNVWLSHAGRDRVTEPDKRKGWMGVNGAMSSTVFVDGWLEGLWRVVDGRPVVVELFRELTKAEKSGLDEELDRATELLAL
ncbi:MAG: winged helix DNA-binding domain-containing protein [Nocardioides sp.]